MKRIIKLLQEETRSLDVSAICQKMDNAIIYSGDWPVLGFFFLSVTPHKRNVSCGNTETCTHGLFSPMWTVWIQSFHYVRITANGLSISCTYTVFISPVSPFTLPCGKMKSTVASNTLAPLQPPTHPLWLAGGLYSTSLERHLPTQSFQDSCTSFNKGGSWFDPLPRPWPTSFFFLMCYAPTSAAHLRFVRSVWSGRGVIHNPALLSPAP